LISLDPPIEAEVAAEIGSTITGYVLVTIGKTGLLAGTSGFFCSTGLLAGTTVDFCSTAGLLAGTAVGFCSLFLAPKDFKKSRSFFYCESIWLFSCLFFAGTITMSSTCPECCSGAAGMTTFGATGSFGAFNPIPTGFGFDLLCGKAGAGAATGAGLGTGAAGGGVASFKREGSNFLTGGIS
jgi:hypothetical protein